MKILKYILAALTIIIVVIVILSLTGTKSQDQGLTDNSQSKANVSIQSVSKVSGDNLAAAGTSANSKIIKWQTSNFPSDATVNINLLRKVTDPTISYELVRKIAENISDIGEFVWTPEATDIGDDLYLEVTCGSNFSFPKGCNVKSEPIKAL